MKSPATKFDDNQILALNSVGLSLTTISKILNCHHTTVATRLRENGVRAGDTRRSFMEDIYTSLTPHQQAWLVNQLGSVRPVKDFVRGLIIEAYIKGTKR